MPAKRYGWKKQQPDFRDDAFRYRTPVPLLAALPPAVNLLHGMPSVLDQGDLGSCGPNAACVLVEFDQRLQELPVTPFSRLFTYYNTRVLMGAADGTDYTGQDSGVDNRTMLKALAQYGFCNESLWPYRLNQFVVRPPDAAYRAAVSNRITSYSTVEQSIQQMRGCLADGRPFLFGFTVYESFESEGVARTGTVPMPRATERLIGGHDVVIYGYDDARGVWLFRNSWDGWGDAGNGTFPYEYGLNPNLSSDFWVINAVPGPLLPPPPPPPPPVARALFHLTFSRAVAKGGMVSFAAPSAIPRGAYSVVPDTPPVQADPPSTEVAESTP